MSKVLPGLLITCLCLSTMVVAQEATPLQLQTALEEALKNNSAITQTRLEEARAKAAFQQTNAIFLPQIKLSYTAISTNNPLHTFGTKLQQQTVTQADFNPETLNNPSAIQNYTTKAEWQQPILNLDLLYQRQAAHLQTEVYTLQTKRMQAYISFEVQKAYAQLQQAYHVRKALDEALLTVKAIHTATANRYAKGLLQQSDVLTVQVQVAATESLLAESISNIHNASDNLSIWMGKPPGMVYLADTTISIVQSENTGVSIPENRADFMAMQSAIHAQELMINASRMSSIPRLNAFAEYMINDRNPFGFGSDSYLAGVQLSWTIFNGTSTRGRITEQRIARDKTTEQLRQQKEQSQLELNKTLRQLQDSRFVLQQQTTAVAQAAEVLRILNNRYAQGLITTNDILQSHSSLSQQKLHYAQAVFQLNTTYAYLQFLTASNE